MPAWLSAFIVLCIVVGFGTYVIYGKEGFVSASPKSVSPKSELSCKQALSACQAACGSSDLSCWKNCGDTATQCYSKATAAATVINSGPLQKAYTDSAMNWATSVGGILGGKTSDGVMSWKNSAGSSTSIPNYYNQLSSLYTNSSFTSPSPSASSSASPSTSPSSSPSSGSPWDWNIGKYFSGWPQQQHNLVDDDSYDPSVPLEGSYVVTLKKWKPHEIPTQEVPGITVDAPTDEGTIASDLRQTALAPSLQQLIRDDAKDAVDYIFSNQYEIKYT